MGDFSRGGEARGGGAVTALDHDLRADAVPVPLGVPGVARGAVPVHPPWLLFGHARETSDSWVDGRDRWWGEREAAHPGVQRRHIVPDNGPAVARTRTPFRERMAAFVDRDRVAVARVYLPPYHRQYNPIERCGGILERRWNGARLSSVAAVLRRAGARTWRGLRPIVGETADVYERGVRRTTAAFRPVAERLARSPTLPKWSVTIRPKKPGD